jgi:phosphoglucosamine mutase
MDTRDGVKVIQPDGWFLVRGSNTEPIIRIVAEARDEQQASEKVKTIIDRITGLPGLR